MMKVIKSMANGSQTTLKVITKKETFLPLLSCAYVYAMPRIRAETVSISQHSFTGLPTLCEDNST